MAGGSQGEGVPGGRGGAGVSELGDAVDDLREAVPDTFRDWGLRGLIMRLLVVDAGAGLCAAAVWVVTR